MTSAALAAFMIRLVTTAGIVISVTLIVTRFGPRVGGLVAGLPVVVGPGLAFVALQETPEILVEVAYFVVVSLTAVHAFILAYGLMARSAGPVYAFVVALSAWAGTAVLVLAPQLGTATAAILAASAAVATMWLLHPDYSGSAPRRVRDGWGSLLFRAGLAGTLVGAVSVGSHALGPKFAGLLLAYPVGITVIAITVHQSQGREAVVATLAAAAVGTLSIVGFAVAVALLTPAFGPATALVGALGAALVVSLVLLAIAR